MHDFTISEDFQKSEIEFDLRFSNPSACYDYLFSTKWPSGFICRKCGNFHYWTSAKHIYICTRCIHQHSLTAGTIMDSTKKPITFWSKAVPEGQRQILRDRGRSNPTAAPLYRCLSSPASGCRT